MNGKTEPVYADIEIYLFDTELSEIIEWLEKRFLLLLPDTETPGNSTTHHFFARTDSTTIKIVIVEKISGGYTSISFQSAHTPWKTDLDCARDAFGHFQVEVRCCADSWSPEQNPDEWLSICQEGESVIIWRA